MQAERWRQIEALFQRALERSPAARAAFLDQVCAGDGELRREVEEMLAADAEAGEFIESAIRRGSELVASDDPLSRGARLGKYEILEKIGAGGFGIVYRGHDPVLKRDVAVKICTSRQERLRQRFFREAKISAALQHPNIVTVHDYGDEQGFPYLVEEYLGGEDLDRMIRRGERPPLGQCLDLLLQIGRGLAFAQARGVLHRDIKPSNIRIEAGHAKILDFGIARLVDQETRLTSEGVTLGTVGYLAPEQLRGEPVDARADVFSFGALAYELLSGARAFRGEDFSQVAYQLIFVKPRPLGELVDCPRSFVKWVDKCLEKAVARRYADVGEAVVDLERLAARYASGGGRARRRVPWLGGAAATGAVVVLALVLARLPPEEAGELADAGFANVAASDAATGQPPVLSPVLSESPSADGGSGAPASAARSGSSPGAAAIFEELDEQSAAAGAPAELRPRRPPPASAAASTQADEPASSLAGQSAAPATPAVQAESEPPAESMESAPPRQPAVARSEPVAGAGASADRSEAFRLLPESRTGERPAIERGDLIATGEGSEPVLLERPQPQFPPLARRRGQEARVIVAVLVDEDGGVIRALVTQGDGSDLGFNEAALAAAERARFLPATRDGIAGKMWTELSFAFRLP